VVLIALASDYSEQLLENSAEEFENISEIADDVQDSINMNAEDNLYELTTINEALRDNLDFVEGIYEESDDSSNDADVFELETSVDEIIVVEDDAFEIPSSEYTDNEALSLENEIMQQLLEEANMEVWNGTGQHTYEALDADGNIVSLTVSLEKELTPSEMRAWQLNGSDVPKDLDSITPGNWSFSIGWNGPNCGDIWLKMYFKAERKTDVRYPLISANRAEPSVRRSPSGFTTTHTNSVNSSAGTAYFDGIFTHTNRNNTRKYKIRGRITGIILPSGNGIRVYNDLYIDN